MSRPIKFRAWDGEVMYHVDTLEFPVGGVRWHGPGVGRGITEVNPKFGWKVDSFLMQFTGLLDKNGKEIYEGDIIELPGIDIKTTVEWKDGSFRILDDSVINQYRIGQWKVIGTIYET